MINYRLDDSDCSLRSRLAYLGSKKVMQMITLGALLSRWALANPRVSNLGEVFQQVCNSICKGQARLQGHITKEHREVEDPSVQEKQFDAAMVKVKELEESLSLMQLEKVAFLPSALPQSLHRFETPFPMPARAHQGVTMGGEGAGAPSLLQQALYRQSLLGGQGELAWP